jgi:preprotein translocase subunit YajC
MLSILADAVAADANISQTFILVGLSALFFYFILWRPDKKRRMKMKYLRDHLKKGDIVIAMGIRATVDEINDRTVILKQYDGSKIEMLRAAITEIESSIDIDSIKSD